MTAERMPFLLEHAKAFDGRASWRAHGIFQRGGMLARFEHHTSRAATAAAAMRYADALGNPSATPASAMASMNIYTYAGNNPRRQLR